MKDTHPLDTDHSLRGDASLDTGTLGKAIAVLDIVTSSDKPLRFTDILGTSGQPRGTLHRILRNLSIEGLITADSAGHYAPGLRLLRFAARSWAGNEFRTIAEPHLRALHEETGETVHLGVISGTEVIYLDKVEGRQSVRMYSQIGNASPIHCTGVGKAAISAAPDHVLNTLLPRLTYRAFTPSTVPDSAALLEEIRNIRTSGHAFDREEHEVGIRCIAAPVYSVDRTFLAAISVTGPAYRISQDDLETWAGRVRGAARAIMDDMQTRLGPRS